MQTLTDGAVIVQGNLEATGRLASRPGVIPVPVANAWEEGNPFEPLQDNRVHNAVTDIFSGSFGSPVLNQTIDAKPATAGFGCPAVAPILPAFVPYIPGKA